MYNSCAFRIAGTDIQNVNSFLPQSSMIKKRLRLDNNFMKNIAPDMLGYEPDFTKRLNKYCSNSVKPLIDSTPYFSQALNSGNIYEKQLNAQSGNLLGKNPNNTYIGTSMVNATTVPATGVYTYIFYDRYGQTGVAYNAADAVIIGSFKWELANNSSVPSTSGLLPDSSMFEIGDYLNISTDSKDTVIKNSLWEITGVTSVSTTNNLTLILSPKSYGWRY